MTQDIRPIPDPTILTTEQLLREIGHLDRSLSDQINALDRLVQSRLAGLDKAIDKAETALAKQVEQMAQTLGAEISAVNKLEDELRGRLITVEASSGGEHQFVVNRRATTMMVIAIIGVSITLMVTIVGVVLFFAGNGSP